MFLLKTRLLLSLGLFFFTIAWEYFLTIKTVFLYSLVVLISGWILLNHVTTTINNPAPILYPIVLETAPPGSHQEFSETEIRNLLKEYEVLLEKQPNHRDLLVNTAILHQALGEVEQSQTYWQQAALLDPNHPIFTQEI